jgi:hypothetical protein
MTERSGGVATPRAKQPPSDAAKRMDQSPLASASERLQDQLQIARDREDIRMRSVKLREASRQLCALARVIRAQIS